MGKTSDYFKHNSWMIVLMIVNFAVATIWLSSSTSGIWEPIIALIASALILIQFIITRNSTVLLGLVILFLGSFIAVRGFSIINPDEFKFVHIVNDFYANASSELLSIAITVLIIDTLNRRRDEAQTEILQAQQAQTQQSQLKAQFIRELGSSDNGFALRALKELHAHGWVIDGSLTNADLFTADLSSANLNDADLRNASFRFTTLKDTRMRNANLEGATFLTSTQMIQMKELRGAILPDGSTYNGRFNLYGDIRNIDKEGFTIDDPISMATFYGVQESEYKDGQEWFKDFEQDAELPETTVHDKLVQQIINGVAEKFAPLLLTNNPSPPQFNQATMRSRDEIAELNKQFILMADENVVSFSGDLSWIENCQEEIRIATNRNVQIRVLCKDPTTSKAQQLLKKHALKQGMQIRFYPYNLVLKARGMMIDLPETKRAVFFKKEHKALGEAYPRGTGNQGDSQIFDYWVRICDKEDDLAIIGPFAQLFDILWNQATPANILENRNSDWQLVENELRKVKQYATSDIDLRKDVKVANLLPIHRFIDEREYDQIQVLSKRIDWHNLDYWDVLSIHEGNSRKIICPPIIEKHNGIWIIVDGLSRVYTARLLGKSVITAVVVETPSEPPVGSNWTWDQVRITNNSDYKKAENFKRPNLEYWRQLDGLHNALSNIKD